jgi:hypothetical protein
VGAVERLKIRIRWYGDREGSICSPMLEVKCKSNQQTGKCTYPLRPFMLDANFTIDVARALFDETVLPDMLRLHLKSLSCVLLNRYTRTYFLSADKKYRITVDDGINAYAMSPHNNSFLSCRLSPRTIIVELKYAVADDETAKVITNRFPFRLTKSSKYIDGVEKLYL